MNTNVKNQNENVQIVYNNLKKYHDEIEKELIFIEEKIKTSSNTFIIKYAEKLIYYRICKNDVFQRIKSLENCINPIDLIEWRNREIKDVFNLLSINNLDIELIARIKSICKIIHIIENPLNAVKYTLYF